MHLMEPNSFEQKKYWNVQNDIFVLIWLHQQFWELGKAKTFLSILQVKWKQQREIFFPHCASDKIKTPPPSFTRKASWQGQSMFYHSCFNEIFFFLSLLFVHFLPLVAHERIFRTKELMSGKHWSLFKQTFLGESYLHTWNQTNKG